MSGELSGNIMDEDPMGGDTIEATVCLVSTLEELSIYELFLPHDPTHPLAIQCVDGQIAVFYQDEIMLIDNITTQRAKEIMRSYLSSDLSKN